MKKILIAGLTGLLVSGCTNLGVMEGSPLGDLVRSSNPDDYKSQFKSPESLDSYYKSASIYGLKVGDKFTQEKGFELVGIINGSKIYKAKKNYKLGKGPIKNKISNLFLGVNPITEEIRNISVNYGSNKNLDSQWVRGNLREYLTGDANGKFYFEKENGVKDPLVDSYRMKVYDYQTCVDIPKKSMQESAIGGIAEMWAGAAYGSSQSAQKSTDTLKCDYNKLWSNYRFDKGLIYGYGINMLFVGERPSNLGLDRMIKDVVNQTSFSTPRHVKPSKKRKVDNNGNVSFFTEYSVPTFNQYEFGMGLEGKLWVVNTVSKNGKENLKEFSIKLKDVYLKPHKNGYVETILYKVPHRLKHTYNDARDYYSIALPRLLNNELGCKIKGPVLPLKMDETKKYKKSFVCKVKGKKVELKIEEFKGDRDYKIDGEIIVTLL